MLRENFRLSQVEKRRKMIQILLVNLSERLMILQLHMEKVECMIDLENVPTGYNEDEPTIGRPEEKASYLGTQDDPLGKDRIGKDAMKNDDQQGYGRDKTKPFAFESTKREFSKHYKTLETFTDKKS